MLVKVCGLKISDQVKELSLVADYIGFIFYEKSKRYVQQTSPSMGAKKVGVFVNESLENVLRICRLEKLNAVQLHGNESPEFCAELSAQLEVIKAFGIDYSFDFNRLNAYHDHINYFLFDTATDQHGGSGRRFDWSLLNRYKGEVPFFLSGGLGLDSLLAIKNLSHPLMAGVDINSRFELTPGNKNISLVKHFIDEFKNN